MLSSRPLFRCLSRRLLVTDRKAVQCQLCLHRKNSHLLWRRLCIAAQAEVATPVALEQDGGPPKIIRHGEQHAVQPKQAGSHLSSKAERPKVGTTLQLECESISSEGKGVCKTAGGLVVFVPQAIPGETLTAVVTNVAGGSARAKKLETLKESPHRVQAPCQHFPACGGCSLQELAYPVQLEQKQQHVREALRRIGKVQDIDKLMQPPVACEEPYHYRNKMTFSVSTSQDSLQKRQRSKLADTPLVGLHAAEGASEIVDIEKCWLQDETSNCILGLVKQSIPQVQQKGSLAVQKVVIRKGSNYVRKRQAVEGDEYMLILHTVVLPRATGPDTDEQIVEVYKELLERLLKGVPQVVSVYECRAVVGREKAFPTLVPLHGKQFLVQLVTELPFHVAPLAFFQTNTKQSGLLLDMIAKAAGLRRNDVLVDLFCGVGVIGISLARAHQDTQRPLKKLWGYEMYNQSVFNARANAKILGLKHKTYLFNSADLTQPKLGTPEKADVVIADPARAGLGSSVIDYLLKCTARTFVYVACDAGTQARDIGLLCQAAAGYEVTSVQICDMFPQTAEVESVAVLKRKPGARQAALAALEAQNPPAANRRQPVKILDKASGFPQIVRPAAGTTRAPDKFPQIVRPAAGSTRGRVGKPGPDRQAAPKAPRAAPRSVPRRGPKGGDDALDW